MLFCSKQRSPVMNLRSVLYQIGSRLTRKDGGAIIRGATGARCSQTGALECHENKVRGPWTWEWIWERLQNKTNITPTTHTTAISSHQ